MPKDLESPLQWSIPFATGVELPDPVDYTPPPTYWISPAQHRCIVWICGLFGKPNCVGYSDKVWTDRKAASIFIGDNIDRAKQAEARKRESYTQFNKRYSR